MENCINVFETLASMCEVTEEDKLRAIPVMIKGDALNYFANNSKSCGTFDDAMRILRSWYKGDDRQARILSKLQEMRLTHAMNKNPDESEIDVFRKFVAELMALQYQLDESYHGYRFLRDRLLTTVDIPHIQSAPRDRLPRTSQQTINRIAIQLSEERKTAGAAAARAARK